MQRISITNPQNIIDGTAKKYYFKLRNTGGPKGDKGDKGDTGVTGPQGPQGDPCTVVVNSTATLEPGSNAYVTNTGSLSNAVLDFGIPKGDRGPQGAKGDKGDTGAQGETGPRGPQGEKGTNATVYIGTTSTLNPGSQATVYNSGTDSSAVLNFGIPQGAKGDPGSQGPQGPQGPTGPAGQNFAPTIVAELPATGDESNLYLTPKAHTTSTATGNPITATVTEDAGVLESFQLDGDTLQQTYTGKNLFGGDMLKQGTWTASTNRARVTLFIACSSGDVFTFTNPDKTTYKADFGVVDTPTQGQNSQYTETGWLDEDTTTYTASYTGYFFVQIGTVVYGDFSVDDAKAVAFQLEKGSTATTYEPYVGGVPSPNPDYPQPIQTVTGEQTVEVIGKNLFDIDSIITGYELISTTGEVRQNVDWWVTPLIPVKASAVYTSSNMRVSNKVFYAADGSFISTISTQTATAPAGARYMRMNAKLSDIPNYTGKAQLELGSTATAYAPYSKQTLPISLGSIELCKLDTYQDYIYKDGDDWKVHKATATITLDGSSDENWAKSNNVFFEYSGYSYVGDVGAGSKALSPSFIYWPNTGGISNNMPNFEFGFPTIKNGIGIRNDNIADADALRTWLSMNVFKAYVSLATATDTTITDTNLIAQLEAIRTASLENGTNTITNTATAPNLAGDMEIGYYGYNPTNRYDKWLWLDINNEYEQIGS